MDTFQKLQQAWQVKHLNHLVYCLENHQDYFQGDFKFEGLKDESVVIDGKSYSKDMILNILAEYYDDGFGVYQTPFGDALYFFFTDVVEDNVDILSYIEEEDVA